MSEPEIRARAEDEAPHPKAEERLEERRQRTVSGWIGIGMSVVAFGVGVLWREPWILGASFLAGMYSGNRLPFASISELVVKIVPWGRG